MKDKFPIPKIAKNSILVAQPKLEDPNFSQSLIYLVEHDDKGAFGLVINRPSGKRLGDVVKNPDVGTDLSEIPVHFGGPVEPGHILLAVFSRGDDGQGMTCRIDHSFEQAEAFLADGKGWVLAFSGYSGWSEGQLAIELKEQAWAITTPDPMMLDPKLTKGMWSVVHEGDDRWKSLVPYLPENPEVN